MPNPPLLVCDTDALVQLLLVNELRPFRILKINYGIQPVIVPEVENELRVHRKYRDQIEARLDKALTTGIIVVLDRATIQACLASSESAIPTAAAQSTMERIQSLGAEYNVPVDLGEAYTLAAAVVLEVPALSNDRTALNSLNNADLAVPSPVLRTFDVIAFGSQVHLLSEADCELIRKALIREGEWVPKEFRSSSFAAGLPSFCARLLDRSALAVGAAPSHGHAYARQLIISSKSS
ncbi:MAG: hypothetical protein ACREI2_07135 [Nitrospiraceae bacterium]